MALLRQWAILRDLCRTEQAQQGLAEKYEVGKRTVIRDLETLSSVFPVRERKEGKRKFFWCDREDLFDVEPGEKI